MEVVFLVKKAQCVWEFARLGSEDQKIVSGRMKELVSVDFWSTVALSCDSRQRCIHASRGRRDVKSFTDTKL